MSAAMTAWPPRRPSRRHRAPVSWRRDAAGLLTAAAVTGLLALLVVVVLL